MTKGDFGIPYEWGLFAAAEYVTFITGSADQRNRKSGFITPAALTCLQQAACSMIFR